MIKLSNQSDDHNFSKNVTTDKKNIIRKMSFNILCKIALYFLLQNLNPLELRSQ